MDNWGDPWADNADSAKSPTKSVVISPLPPTFAPAPPLLNGFLDDAGWGNDDDSFGDWSAATIKEVEHAPTIDTSVPQPLTTQHIEQPLEDIQRGAREELEQHAVHDEGDWAGVRLDAPVDEELVLSETSDSSTTVQADHIAEDPPADTSTHLHPDDDSSTRASTSPSETSHTDAPVESPRTSYEEERGVVKSNRAEADESFQDDTSLPDRVVEISQPASGNEIVDEDLGDGIHSVEDTDRVESLHSPVSCSAGVSGTSGASIGDASEPHVFTDTSRSSDFDSFAVDLGLLRELFPSQEESAKLGEAPDDPIYTTSGRKAWYRLTRKQTLREFNNGNDDDNYIRVTWADSNIRSEVNKVVGRWAREDRISGTGPGARASFYWDTPAPIDSTTTGSHMRQRSSVVATEKVTAARESLPPLSVNTPAAFNWSSASASADPWQQASSGIRSTSSPIAPIAPMRTAVTKMQNQGARAVSLDLTSQTLEPTKHARNLTATNETPAVASLISPPITNTNDTPSDPWNGINTFDAPSAPQNDLLTAPVDDEDEWGEMVSSPTVSTPTTSEPTQQADARNNTISTAITTPQSLKAVVNQDQSPNAMYASSIVRLKSTISPTSALFKTNSFIPLGAEQRPIGPGILKPAKRSVSITSKKVVEKQQPAQEQIVVAATEVEEVPKVDPLDEFSAWQAPVPEVAAEKKTEKEASPVAAPLIIQEVARPSTPSPPAPAPVQSNIDAWADADFSFFESALPAASPPQLKSDPTDSFSRFESRERSTSAASSAKTFTRSPPRKVTPPPVQPLTGATSSAQRRKTEEDQIIQEILSGLPDLSYMLR